MKLFRQLLGRKPKEESTENKLKALDLQPTSALEDLVLGTVGDPSNVHVRVKALQRLPYSALILDIALQQRNAPDLLVRTARLQIARWIDAHDLTISALIGEVSDSQKLLSIVGYCKSSQWQKQILDTIVDEPALVHVCLQASSPAVRKSIAERVEGEDALKELAKQLKSKDKTAYKVIKKKLDKLRQEESVKNAIREKVEAICVDAQQQSKRVMDKEYPQRVNQIERRWAVIVGKQEAPSKQGVSAEMQARYQEALGICHALLEKHAKEIAEESRYQESLAQADKSRQQQIDRLWLALNLLYSGKNSDASEALEGIKSRWSELKAYGKTTSIQQKQYTQLLEAYQGLLSEMTEGESFSAILDGLKGLPEPKEVNAQAEVGQAANNEKRVRQLVKFARGFSAYQPGETLMRAFTALKAIDDLRNNEKELNLQCFINISGLIKKAQSAVKDGRLKQASGMRRTLTAKMASMHSVPANIAKQLDELEDELQKLVDWQSYAVVPKKNELIGKMQALVGIALPEDALATEVKALQYEWKGLRQSGSERNEDLWQQFSDAADKAYAPCKAYFQALSNLRKLNIDKRQALIAQLDDFLSNNDWGNADWKVVEKILRTARQELHSYTPVDRVANKPVQAAFDAATKAIQEKLEAEYGKNRSAKEQIITQAEKLGEVNDIEQGIDTAKRLQSQWKKIGRCAYKENEALWKLFRSHCDTVFSKKESQVSQMLASQEENYDLAQAVLGKIDALIALEGENILNSRSEFDALKAEYHNLGEVPSNKVKTVAREYAKRTDAYDAKAANTLKQAKVQTWDRLFETCKKINDYLAQAIDAGESDAAAKEEVQGFIDGISRWPEGGRVAVNNKLALDASLADIDLSANETALALLCIRAEILAGVDSPESDKAARMAYQVQMLQQGMGMNAGNTCNVASLTKEWVEAGPVSSASYESLFRRFHERWKASQ